MDSQKYEIVYIDKFIDIVEAEIARDALRQRFHLSEKIVERLSSGMPVVIKKSVDLHEAERYQQAIKEAGGVCWVQQMTPDCAHHERRLFNRRMKSCRRNEVRSSSIVPDRRKQESDGGGRRSRDNSHH
jgi:hypothetical protein